MFRVVAGMEPGLVFSGDSVPAPFSARPPTCLGPLPCRFPNAASASFLGSRQPHQETSQHPAEVGLLRLQGQRSQSQDHPTAAPGCPPLSLDRFALWRIICIGGALDMPPPACPRPGPLQPSPHCRGHSLLSSIYLAAAPAPEFEEEEEEDGAEREGGREQSGGLEEHWLALRMG